MSKFFQKYGLFIFYAFCIVALIIVIGNAIKEKLIVPPGASKDLVVNESLEKAKEEVMTTEEEENAMRSQIEENKAETQNEEPTNNEENTQTEETNNNSNEKINDKTEEPKKEESSSNTKEEPTNNQTSNEKIYKIELDPQGGTGTTNSIYLKYNDGWYFDETDNKQISTVTVPTKDNYTFDGYYIKSNGTGEKIIDSNGIILGNKSNVNSNTKIYAKWIQKTYIISLDPQGGNSSVNRISLKYGSGYSINGNTITSISKPTKSNSTFSGYYTSPDGKGTEVINSNGKIVTNNKFFKSNTTIYAYWKAKKEESTSSLVYSIALNNQNASSSGTNTIYFKYNINYYSDSNATKAISTISLPKKTGYLFNGYYTKTNGNGTMVIDNNGRITSDKKLFKSSSTIYAYWIPLKYTISYNCNGGTNTPSSQIATYGSSFEMTKTLCKKNGYTQTSWVDSKGTSWKSGWSISKWSYTNGQYGISNYKLELKAVYSSKTVKVIFYKNTSSTDTTNVSQTFSYGKSNQSFSSKNWSLKGYTLSGWSTNRSGSGTIYALNTSINNEWIEKNSPSIKLYAIWKPIKYTISFSCNGGSGSISSQTATYGSSFTLTSKICNRSGYTQSGWLDPSGSVFKSGWSTSKWSYVNGDHGISNNKLALKANWITTSNCSNTSKIHFINVGNGDSILLESNCHYGLVDTGNPYKDGTPQALTDSIYTGIHVKNYLKSIGLKHLDFIIATHSHSDHIGGIKHIVDAGFVNDKTVYYYRKYETNRDEKIHGASSSDNWDNYNYYKRAINSIQNAKAKLIDVTNISKSFNLGDFNIKLLNTESLSKEGKNPADYGENENSIVELVTYKGKYKTFLGADIVKSDENKLIKNNQISTVDIFKLGHHGLYTSTGYDFVETLKPKTAIISSHVTTRWNVASIYYMMNKYNTKVYQTGRTKDAIVATFTSTGYTVKAEENKSISPISLSTVKTDGKWKKIATYKINGELNTPYWYYIENNTPALGWKKIVYNGKENSYYFIKSAANAGRMATGWVEISNKWYYFDSDGAMAKGWRNLTYKGQKSWFYLKSNGVMAESETLTINGSTFKFNSNGVCVSGKGC